MFYGKTSERARREARGSKGRRAYDSQLPNEDAFVYLTDRAVVYGARKMGEMSH